jgi:hypothetical protein
MPMRRRLGDEEIGIGYTSATSAFVMCCPRLKASFCARDNKIALTETFWSAHILSWPVICHVMYTIILG